MAAGLGAVAAAAAAAEAAAAAAPGVVAAGCDVKPEVGGPAPALGGPVADILSRASSSRRFERSLAPARAAPPSMSQMSRPRRSTASLS